MKRVAQLQGGAAGIRDFLARSTERKSTKGNIRKSNVTDNDSAKMAMSKGVIQGYCLVHNIEKLAKAGFAKWGRTEMGVETSSTGCHKA